MTDIKWCIDYLKDYNHINYDLSYDWSTLRKLLNITMPINISDEFYIKQDRILKDILSRKDIIDVATFSNGVSLYKGDITLLKADAIVNACNSQMLGCFVPGHHCIDNAIHSFAGLQVRRDMLKIMKMQGHEEESGHVKVSSAYNLPSKYIFHTVGPIYSGTFKDETDLASCYYSCLRKADEMGLDSIVFCSLSTGIFGFPIEKASRIAIKCVDLYLKEENKNIKKVIFDVFNDNDYKVYENNMKEVKL
ncbi:MAG: macro domain-containing protein [Gammaproteobacteria bacterium]|nr:macro domain-containing protein [Gammaproteobacteria bacterium]